MSNAEDLSSAHHAGDPTGGRAPGRVAIMWHGGRRKLVGDTSRKGAGARWVSGYVGRFVRKIGQACLGMEVASGSEAKVVGSRVDGHDWSECCSVVDCHREAAVWRVVNSKRNKPIRKVVGP